jgi:hypothetical protein
MDIAYIRNHGYTFPVRPVLNVAVNQDLPPFSPPVSRAGETVLIETQHQMESCEHKITCTEIILLALALTSVTVVMELLTAPSNMVVKKISGLLTSWASDDGLRYDHNMSKYPLYVT